MRTRAKYQRQQLQLTVEFHAGEGLYPVRDWACVHNVRQARVAFVRMALLRDMPVRRAWVVKYQFGNVTERERELAHEFWLAVPFASALLPPYVEQRIFLKGGKDDDEV
jgi:hypothetical protein